MYAMINTKLYVETFLWQKVGSAGLARKYTVSDKPATGKSRMFASVALLPLSAGDDILRVHSVGQADHWLIVYSRRPSFSRSPSVFVARQVDRATIMGCPVLFPVGRERPQFYSLNFGTSGLESLPVTRLPHRQRRYRVIVNRKANSKQCRHRGGCYDKCAVSALSRLASRRVVPVYDLHFAYQTLPRMHTGCVMRKSTVSQNNSDFPIRAVFDIKSKN
jgi:hypothetical protein